MALTSKLIAQIIATESGTLDLGTKQAKVSASYSQDLASGTGSAAADMIWTDERTITASSNEDLDLAGSLAGAFGNTLTFAKIKAILVIANSANTNDVVVGGAGSSAFTGPFNANTSTVSIKPGGVFMIGHPGTGWTVTATSGDLLRVANSSSGTSVTYKIVLIGTSA